MYTDQRKREFESRRVAIREVNMETGFVTAQDAFAATFQISLDFHAPMVAIPVPGEMWLISRRGNDYYLERKLESDGEANPLSTLGVGDRRVAAPGVVYLDGTEVRINGQTIEEIVVPQFTQIGLDIDAVEATMAAQGVSLTALINALSALTLLPGEMRMYGGSAAPAGWLLCQGQLLSRTTYATLYGVVAFNYSPTPGVDPGTNNFYLPDFRGRVPQGLGTHADNDALGKNDGITTVANRTTKHSHGTGTLAVSASGGHGHTFTGNLNTSQAENQGHVHYASSNSGNIGGWVATLNASGGSHAHTNNANTLGGAGSYGWGFGAGEITATIDPNTHSHPSTEFAGYTSGAHQTHTHTLTPTGTISSTDTHVHANGSFTGRVGTTTAAPEEGPANLVVNVIIKT